MNLFHRTFSYLAHLVYKITKVLRINNKNSLRVIMYHDIKKKDFQKFSDQIKLIKKDGWSFVDPKKLEHLRKKKIRGKNVILTFDDGFYSNYLIAKKILKKHNIKAIFFIPYNFMMMKNKKNCLYFIKNRLKIKNYKLDQLKKINMNLHDTIDLSKKNHVVGFHTKSHVELSKCKTDKKLYDEIAGPVNNKFKKIISFNKYFSFPFGKINDVSEKSFNIAKTNYKFIFLGIRGENKMNLKNSFIFRDNFTIDYDKKMILSILNGYFDFFYFFKRRKLFKLYSKI